MKLEHGLATPLIVRYKNGKEEFEDVEEEEERDDDDEE